ncbi:MAG TPA: hypothetical protein ENK57_10605 [Polyangiaceae bacterium]|nr:hypothetical protein [Polyangiaceae bacterium]
MTDIIKELAAREQAEQAEALNAYYALAEVIAEGADIGADDDTAAIVAKAGKTSKDLEADLALFRRKVALAAEVAELDEAQQDLRAVREEGAQLRAKHEAEKKRMKDEEDDLKVRDFALFTRAQDLRTSARELEELNAKIEQARTGGAPKPAPAEPKRRTAHQLLPTTKRRPDGWSPPSDYDYDKVETTCDGKRAFIYKHRRTGEVIYPPSHPRYAG